MKVVVVYESMFGNTHAIADAIGLGLRARNEVVVVPVARASRELVEAADLVVVGGPTHVHGMSRANTRKAALQMVTKPGSDLKLDADAEGLGLRDWFAALGEVRTASAAFDTRLEGPAAFTGQASHAIRRQLRSHGFAVVAKPESFLVNGSNKLRPGEQERARQWGEQLADQVAQARAPAA